MTRKKSNQKKGSDFENKVKKTMGSGNLWFQKGDLNYEDYCIECKFTDKKGFRVSAELLEKLWNQALNANKEPLLTIGIPRNDDEIFVIEGRVNLERR